MTLNYYTSRNRQRGNDSEQELKEALDFVDGLIDKVFELYGEEIEKRPYILQQACIQLFECGSLGTYMTYEESLRQADDIPWYYYEHSLCHGRGYTNAYDYENDLRYFTLWKKSGRVDCWGGVLVMELLTNRASERAGFSKETLWCYYADNGTDHAWSIISCDGAYTRYGFRPGYAVRTNLPGGTNGKLIANDITVGNTDEPKYALIFYEIKDNGVIKEISYKSAQQCILQEEFNLAATSIDGTILLLHADIECDIIIPDTVKYVLIMYSGECAIRNITLGKNTKSIHSFCMLYRLNKVDGSKCKDGQVVVDGFYIDSPYVQEQAKKGEFVVPLWSNVGSSCIFNSSSNNKTILFDEETSTVIKYIGPLVKVKRTQTEWITSLTHQLSCNIMELEIYD